MSSNPYKYFAFISYSHADMRAAKRLKRLLEWYNLPASVKKEVKRSNLPEEVKINVANAPRRMRIFRDKDELTSGILSEELHKKLKDSKFLIVICSPASAQSKYVGDEIDYFKSLGRERQIIPFIISGTVAESMHPKFTGNKMELLGIEVKAEEGRFKFHKAFIRTVAKMFELDRDILWNKRKRFLVKLAIGAAMLVSAIAGVTGYMVQREKPFDSAITINEAGGHHDLPLSTNRQDSLFIYLGENDVRAEALHTLADIVNMPNIPGKFRGKDVRIVCNVFSCHPLDTVVRLTGNVHIDIVRNPEIYGRIKYYVIDVDEHSPAADAVFDFGSISATTDSKGLLDVLVPLEHQKSGRYEVRITHKGHERKVRWRPELDPLEDRTDIPVICLE